MRKRMVLAHNERLGWHVDMPTYSMVAGAFSPVVPGVIHANGIDHPNPAQVIRDHAPSVEVELPDDTPMDLLGNVDAQVLRHRYRDHPHFGADTWQPPTELKGKV